MNTTATPINNGIKTVLALTVYAIAMGLIEAVVVVYLRELYYPSGFLIQSATDLQAIPLSILRIEMWREAATIVMLVAVGYLAYVTTKKRIAAFLFAFAIWDLAYYFFLYFFLGWPSSFTVLDVYFLIPFAWIGPVWIPLILFGLIAATSSWSLLKNVSGHTI